MTFDEAWSAGKKALSGEKLPSPALDSLILLAFAAGGSKERVVSNLSETLDGEALGRYEALIGMRRRRAPVAYLTGTKEFMGLGFIVDKNVLIPRPETETVAEEAIRTIRERGLARVLDLCTGSGCIGVSIAHYCETVSVTASDICPLALETAKKNAAALAAGNRVSFALSDLFENVGGGFDMIVSNPPYIKDMDSLPEEVKDYEPGLALYGGADGLDFYRRILGEVGGRLKPDGDILLETGCDMADTVAGMMEKDFTSVRIIKDLAGRSRACAGRRRLYRGEQNV